MYLTFPLLEKK